jgi:bacterioferritin-associated ferredoxin
MTSYVVVERFWCLCCGTTEQVYRYPNHADALAELDLKNTLHAAGKCCGSCTRTAWIEHQQEGES